MFVQTVHNLLIFNLFFLLKDVVCDVFKQKQKQIRLHAANEKNLIIHLVNKHIKNRNYIF